MINYHYPAFSQAGNGSVKHRPMEQSIEMPSVFKKMTRQVYNAEPYSLDDTMDTSEMMNQMVQMQMVTAITNMTETSIMSYAGSLVGKVVTIGLVQGDSLEEREVVVIGTGMMNGQQVIFGKDGKGNVETYTLNQIMAVGHLPPLEGEEQPGGADKPGEGGEGGDGEGGVEGPGEGGDGDKVEGGGDSGEKPTDPGETPAPQMIESPEYTGEQGVPTDL